MADRSNIKDAFWSELLTAATGTYTVAGDTYEVAEGDVSMISPDGFESLPAVAYDESYSRRSVNGVGMGPDARNFSGGTLDSNEHHGYRTGTFTIYVAGQFDGVMEAVYEDVHRAFGKYDEGFARAGDFHPDCERVVVEDASSSDYSDEDAPIRMDTLTVEVEYHRVYEEAGDVIESVDDETSTGGSVYHDETTT